MHFEQLQEDIINDYVKKDKPFRTAELKFDRPIDSQSQSSRATDHDQIISSQSDADGKELKQAPVALQPELRQNHQIQQ